MQRFLWGRGGESVEKCPLKWTTFGENQELRDEEEMLYGADNGGRKGAVRAIHAYAY